MTGEGLQKNRTNSSLITARNLYANCMLTISFSVT